MNKNKEEIQYILRFYYKIEKNTFKLLQKFVMLINMWCSINMCGTKLVQAFSI